MYMGGMCVLVLNLCDIGGMIVLFVGYKIMSFLGVNILYNVMFYYFDFLCFDFFNLLLVNGGGMVI